MSKKRLLLLAILAAVMSVACVMFVACGNKKDDETVKYAITWTVDEHSSVKVEGYDTPPAEVADGTVINFTVSFDNGYELNSVTGGSVKKSGNGYTFTVTKDVEIKVSSLKTIASLEVTNTVETYNAGETVNPETVTVIVNYVVGDSETVTGDKCTYVYQNGYAFSLGDTKYTVKYRNGSVDVTFDEAIVGKITLDLYGGQLSAEDLANLPDGAIIKDGIVSWTFDEPIEEDIVLPEPTKIVNGVELPFLRWSGDGVTDNKITATSVSVNAIAAYDVVLVQLESIELIYKDVTETVSDGEDGEKEVTVKDVPFLVLTGKFAAATEVYLYLYEGNEPPVSLMGPSVKAAEDNNDFVCEFDLRNLADSKFNGKWMDILICAVLDGRTETQQIDFSDTEKYPDGFDGFVQGANEVAYEDGDNYYKFNYQVWVPETTDKDHNGVNYLGTEKFLKLQFTSTSKPDFTLNDITLREKDEKAYLVIPGQGLKITDKTELETALSGLIADLCAFNAWDNNLIGTQTVTVNNDLTFEILICLDKITANGNYVMHVSSGKYNPTGSDSNFVPANFDKDAKLEIGDLVYTLESYDTGWGWNWLSVKFADNGAPTVTKNYIGADSEHAYIIVEGDAKGKTADQIKTYVTSLDVQQNGGSYSYTYIYKAEDNETYKDNIIVTVNPDGTYVLKGIIPSNLSNSNYYVHINGLIAGNGDANLDVNVAPVVAGDKVYYAAETNQLAVADKGIVTVSSSYVVAENDKAYFVLTGYALGNTEEEIKAKLTQLDFEEDGGSKTVIASDKITVTIEDGVYTIKGDISELNAAKYWVHAIGIISGNGDVSLNTNMTPVTVDGKTYSVTSEDRGSWTAVLFTIVDAE